MAALDFPLGFDVDEMVDDTLTGTCTLFDDNCLSSTAQVLFPADKSPFHESDSGVSDITCVTSASPSRDTDIMLDELIDNKQFTPFGVDDCGDHSFLDFHEEGGIDVEGGDDIHELLARYSKENVTAVHTSAQTVVRQSRKRCDVGGTGGPVTRRQKAAMQVSTNGSLASSAELKQAVSLIDDSNSDLDVSDTGDEEDYQPKFSARKAKGSIRITKPGTPIVKQDQKSLPNIRCVTNEPAQSGVKSVKVLQVVRTDAAGHNTADEVIRALEDRNRKNAEQAKLNRQKKKAYVQGLEQQVEEAQSQVDVLQKRLEESETEKESWKKEVEYLKAVLANQSALAGLLKNIPSTEGVSLSSSFVSRKRSAEMDHSYTPSKKQCSRSLSSAGVCLHVDSDKVSLEFCHHCAVKAKGMNEST